MEPTNALEQVFGDWNQYMIIIGTGFVVLGALIFLYHEFRLLQIRDYKDKYDYVNTHEIKYFWYAIFMLIIAGFFFSNTVLTHRVITHGMLWFWVRLFITVSMSFIAYFFFNSIVRIYYPKRLEKRLVYLRHKPRISPQGNQMRRLSEEEEDAHMDEAQIAEEASAIHSVDYDVWLDEKTGFKKIEKYMAYQHAEECPECGYYTMKIYSEEVEKSPTQDETGLLLKHYRCNYCRHREVREVVLAKFSTNVK
ncbi:MAG: hypothetical protein WDO14_04145 [Bacteroidota bacterium]